MGTERLDLRGVGCPMNLVKVTLAWEGLAPGAVLQVLLDAGEPYQNVRRSLAERRVPVREVPGEAGPLLELRRPVQAEG